MLRGVQAMPPITKDSDTPTTASGSTARSGSAASPNDSGAKQQPVAVEIPITINGARTVEGSDKREPFSESTKTVMVFGSGAVIKLASSMTPGQLLFLTNERSKKEVVCQVVKSKNYRSASGYVELEFTEPAVGFWGMRFPSDRIRPGPQATAETTRPVVASPSSSAPSRPTAQKTEPPLPSGTPSTAAAKPPVAVKPLPPAAPASSIGPPAPDSASLPGAPKTKPDSNVSAAPTGTSLGADEPLIEPWLRKRQPVPKVVAEKPIGIIAPEPPAKSPEPEPSLPTTPIFELTRPSDQPASLFAPVEAPAKLSGVDLSSLAPFFEVNPAPADVVPEAPKGPAANDPEAEELKHHTARLQEELSQMEFAEPVASSAAKPEVETPCFPLSELAISAIKTDLVHESAVRLVENSETSSADPLPTKLPAPDEPLKDAQPATIPALETLAPEELKIPAWLEPLARNASAPSSTQELVREKARRRSEQLQLAELTAPLVAPVGQEHVAESRVPTFGSALPFDGAKSVEESLPKKSGKGMGSAAMAAGLLVLAGGGWWYMHQQSAGVPAKARPVQAANIPAASQDLQTNAPNYKEAASGAQPAATNANAPANAADNLSSSARAASPAYNPQTDANSVNGGNVASSAASATPEPVPAAEKKPVLGEVHLAAPKISQKRTVQSTVEPDAGISLSEDQPEANTDSLGAGLGVASNQPAAPAAPVAVGGDIKQAKLISSVPPVYPTLARAQHVSGGVTIDALIDANGRVTTMQVISGHTLLQQAAMDALKQSKYQPAMLDGKAVPTHLTVTIQFHLQ
jgi:TonB family protein